jgi:hypothetical protein
MLTKVGGLIMAPNNVYDLTWLFFSTVTVALVAALIGVLCYFGKRICNKMDVMSDAIGELRTSEAVNELTISTHIDNDGVHCKGVLCAHLKPN